ncbi:MAG TPA: ABC transporter permease [Puia sp.]|jgi:lipopolysaccharide transport system permease protein|nr:ABC transporter permease [Puia sp.]
MPDELVIEAGASEKNYWKDLWRYRELFYILSWRDIKVRYKQTAIGAAWSIIRPLLTMIIFTIIFGRVAKLPPEGSAPYAIMVYAAMLPWQFFANALGEASNSLIGNTNLITKIYFPRMIIPASSVIVSFVDFGISFILMLALMIWYHFAPSWQIIFLPLFILMAFLASFGISLYITALNVKYRDFRYIIPFIVQFGLYVSPVGFSSSVVPEKWRLLYSLNPMVGVIDGFRWSILGEQKIYLPGFLVSNLVIVFFCFIGVRYFRKTEKTFADNI